MYTHREDHSASKLAHLLIGVILGILGMIVINDRQENGARGEIKRAWGMLEESRKENQRLISIINDSNAKTIQVQTIERRNYTPQTKPAISEWQVTQNGNKTCWWRRVGVSLETKCKG